MFRYRPAARTLPLPIALAACLVAVLLGPVPHGVEAAWDGCTLTGDVGGTTCPLRDGDKVEGTLEGGTVTYRVDTVAPDATIDLTLAGSGGSAQVDVLDWRGESLLAAGRAHDMSEVRLSTKLAEPGVYGVRVRGEPSSESPGFALTSRLSYPGPVGQPIWPRGLGTGDGPVTNEHQVIRVPRGGTPTGGVAASRILTAPPVGIFGDFTLVADVQFAQISGPAALTVRFRYEPEAGGGTGYLLSIDPFNGTAFLDYFDEGRRHAIVAPRPLPLTVTSGRVNRLVLSAHGPTILARLDGQALLETTDTRFSKGLVAVGAVTWSDPVAVTFDHVQVSTPRR